MSCNCFLKKWVYMESTSYKINFVVTYSTVIFSITHISISYFMKNIFLLKYNCVKDWKHLYASIFLKSIEEKICMIFLKIYFFNGSWLQVRFWSHPRQFFILKIDGEINVSCYSFIQILCLTHVYLPNVNGSKLV